MPREDTFWNRNPGVLYVITSVPFEKLSSANAVISIKFKSLDANLNLLEYLLQAKQALLAQNALVDSLTDMIRQVRAEKEDLQMSLEAQRRQHVQEMNNMQGYLSQLIRTDEE